MTRSVRPGRGSVTARVWDIADELTRRTGTRARRSDVIEAYAQEGGNRNTAGTQFQIWKQEFDARVRQLQSPSPPTAVQLKDGGRVLLPVEVRETLGLREGETLFAHVVDGEIHLVPRATALKRAQDLVRKFIDPQARLVDALLDARKDEVRGERP